MKKMIIGIAILIQCIDIGAMENQRRNTPNNSSNFLPANHFDTKTGVAVASQRFAGAMKNQRASTPRGSNNFLPANCFDVGIDCMGDDVLNAIKAAASDKAALSREIAKLSSGYRNYFDRLRVQINQEHFRQMTELQQQHETVLNETIQEKDREIRRKKLQINRLQAQVKSQASSLNEATTDISHLEAYIQRLENDLQAKRTAAATTEVSDLFSDDDFANNADIFDNQLHNMEDSINADSNNADAACNTIKSIYDVTSNMIISDIKRRHTKEITRLTNQFDEKERLLKEEYDKTIESLNEQIQTLTNENTRLQCKLDLMRSVNQVLSANPSLAGRPLIRTRAASVKAITDFVQRKNTMEDLYNRFRAFSNLYGRTDLGVKATKVDFNKVQNWIATAQNAYSLYGRCVFPAPSRPYLNEEGKDCPTARNEIIDGRGIGTPLYQIRGRIEEGLKILGRYGTSVRGRLDQIWQSTPAADNYVQMTWYHPIFWGHTTNELCFYRNGNREGRFFHEYGGGCWKDMEGFVGNYHGKWKVGCESGDARDTWNPLFVPRYNAALEETKNAILQREAQLLDLETNPESELNKAYRQARRISPTCVDVPVVELDSLIRQYNEFMRM